MQHDHVLLQEITGPTRNSSTASLDQVARSSLVCNSMVAHHEDIAYEVEGSRMIGRLAVPDGSGRRPGVLIAHEGNGLDEYQKERAQRFADLGYVAFALDYFGDGRPLDDRSEINDRMTRLSNDPDYARRIATAGLDVLLAHERTDTTHVAAVGYCFGGALMLELARTGADLKAVVGFHPALFDRRPDSDSITGTVLMCVGADDPLVPPADRDAFAREMQAANVDWTMIVLGGAKHSFTNPHVERFGLDALAYNETADRRSWAAMLDLFNEVLTTT
jgi:dienelactone hydrolase